MFGEMKLSKKEKKETKEEERSECEVEADLLCEC